MSRIRSGLFNAYWAGWTALFILPLGVLAALGAPARPIRAFTRLWSRGILFGLRAIIGLTYVEEGRARIPSEPCLIVANHQSTWETFAFLALFPDVAIVAKRELLAIPVFAWFLRKSPMILIDRDSGSVRIDGEVWTARPYDEDDTFEAGQRVSILQIRGATALVSE